MPATLREQNVARTKNAILKAAQVLFATRGYAEAGVRDIAERARVNPALIARYYGSKAELFATALEASLDVSVFTSTKREEFGEALSHVFCDTKASAALAVPMLVFAAGDTQARKAALQILQSKVAQPLANWFATDDAADRATQVIVLVTGFYTYRLMLPLEPLKGEPSPGMREWLARSLQQIVDR
ncbi:TetR family transcriptional regulator [Novosphingobium sp. M1R2S20]|uniref:TetR family transcriptional regulator n=1 Tax=Novosphingobium rhizovicinum TaxID=3228928 RepID=A0ABV3REP4_9SPHN